MAAAPNYVTDFYNFTEAHVRQRQKEEVLQKLEANGSRDRKDILHYLINGTEDNEKPAYTVEELYAETTLILIAAVETTATIVVGFWFYLTRHPRVYSKLMEELITTFKSADDIRAGPALTSCKYLQACIDEAMRMAPAGTGELPREVLPGGLEINGHLVPEGTQLGVTVWSLNHNQDTFKDPWVFRPEPWIVDPLTGVSEEDVTQVRASFYPFSMGLGSCPGQKLALEELRLLFARTLFRMDVRLTPGDKLGGGTPELGWGLRDKDHVAFQDAYISIRDGPMVQFRRRTAN